MSKTPQKQIDAVRRYKARYEDKRLSHQAVTHAVRSGALPSARTLTCTDCAGPATEYDHHIDYSEANRLKVQPVCRPCHVKRGVERGSFRRPLVHGCSRNYPRRCRCSECRLSGVIRRRLGLTLTSLDGQPAVAAR